MALRHRLANGPLVNRFNRAQPRTRPNTAIMGSRSRPLFVRPAAAVLGAIFGACLSAGLSAGLSAAGAQSPDTGSRDAAAFAALEIAETETVVEIVDGDTLVLADGRQVRLVGLQMTDGFKAFQSGSSSTHKIPTNARFSP